MSSYNDEWRPAAENLFHDEEGEILDGLYNIRNSVESLLSRKESYSGQCSEIYEYLENRDTDTTFEFVIHPDHVNTAIDYRELFGNERYLNTWSLSHETYLEALKNAVQAADENNRPIFLLYSSKQSGEFEEAALRFARSQLDLETDSYETIPTVEYNGLVTTGIGEHELLTVLSYSPELDARVSGEEHGRCTLQFEIALNVLSNLSDDLDINVYQGPKFPLRPINPDDEIVNVSEMRTEKARREYEEFLEKLFSNRKRKG